MKKIKSTKTTKSTKQISGGIDHGPDQDPDGGVLMCNMVGMSISEA